MTLLARILEIFFPPRDHEAIVRRSALEELSARAAPETIMIKGTPITFLLPYRAEIVKSFVREAKFHANEKAQRLLGAVLAEFVRNHRADADSFEKRVYILVPIPLSRQRRRQRGYNQAERIASHAKRAFSEGITVDTGLLARTRDTVPQTSLAKGARIANMHGAFMTTKPASSSVTYIVIDDVSTTGATLISAHTALHEAGAVSILLLALAH